MIKEIFPVLVFTTGAVVRSLSMVYNVDGVTAGALPLFSLAILMLTFPFISR